MVCVLLTALVHHVEAVVNGVIDDTRICRGACPDCLGACPSFTVIKAYRSGHVFSLVGAGIGKYGDSRRFMADILSVVAERRNRTVACYNNTRYTVMGAPLLRKSYFLGKIHINYHGFCISESFLSREAVDGFAKSLLQSSESHKTRREKYFFTLSSRTRREIRLYLCQLYHMQAGNASVYEKIIV